MPVCLRDCLFSKWPKPSCKSLRSMKEYPQDKTIRTYCLVLGVYCIRQCLFTGSNLLFSQGKLQMPLEKALLLSTGSCRQSLIAQGLSQVLSSKFQLPAGATMIVQATQQSHCRHGVRGQPPTSCHATSKEYLWGGSKGPHSFAEGMRVFLIAQDVFKERTQAFMKLNPDIYKH